MNENNQLSLDDQLLELLYQLRKPSSYNNHVLQHWKGSSQREMKHILKELKSERKTEQSK